MPNEQSNLTVHLYKVLCEVSCREIGGNPFLNPNTAQKGYIDERRVSPHTPPKDWSRLWFWTA